MIKNLVILFLLTAVGAQAAEPQYEGGTNRSNPVNYVAYPVMVFSSMWGIGPAMLVAQYRF